MRIGLRALLGVGLCGALAGGCIPDRDKPDAFSNLTPQPEPNPARRDGAAASADLTPSATDAGTDGGATGADGGTTGDDAAPALDGTDDT